MSTSYFITGTDTDVGKTIATAALAAAWQADGEKVTVMKPVQTGATQNENGDWSAPDLDYSLGVLQQDITPEEYRLHAPVCYEPPCSPHLAAVQANRPVNLQTIQEAHRSLIAQYDRVLLEGAGGLMVPLSEDWDMIDLIKALNLPCILVTRPNLGTLNHTQLSADALAQAGIPLAGWICVARDPEPWGFIEEDNIETLSKRLEAPYLGTIPFIEGAEDPGRAREGLIQSGTRLIEGL